MLTLLLTAGAELVAFVLRLAARNLYAACALAVSALSVLSYVFEEVFKEGHAGRSLTDSDTGLLVLELSILALALLSLGRFSRAFPWTRIFFWLGWALNLALIGVFAYVLALWRGFA